MHTHIVYCHPSRQSLAGEILHSVRHSLQEFVGTGHLTEALLYEQGFNPVLSAQEYQRYADRDSVDALTATYVRQLENANRLVVVFPVWMYGPPALLKGYLDKVWRPGVTFSLTHGNIRPLLTRLERITVLCTFGQSRDTVVSQLDPIHNIFIRMMEQNCTAACRLVYEPCYGCDTLNAADRKLYLDSIGRFLDA